MRHFLGLVTVAFMLLVGTSAAGQAPSAAAASSKGSLATTTTTVGVTKVLVIVEENHSVTQMRTGMPYLNALGREYGQAMNYRAVSPTSLPNYLAMVGGSTFGVTDGQPPSAHPIRGASVFGQAVTEHLESGTYAQSMRGTCELTGDRYRGYTVRHNPQTYFVGERAQCSETNRGDEQFAADAANNRLPTIGFLIPDKCSDAHDCSLSTADTYLKKTLMPVLASEDFTSGRLAVVITTDEDDHRGPNYVYTVVLQVGVHSQVSRAVLTHYSLSRLLSEVTGLPPLRSAAKAGDLAAAFGIRVERLAHPAAG